jgi:xylose isomerase
MDQAAAWMKMDAAFDFFTRLGAPFYCFHDVDAMPAAANIKEHVANFAMTVDRLEKKQAETGVKLLWGTANLFSHPRYMGGASTNPDPEVWAFAATQVRHCLDATKRLGGANYVLWGGREGYDTLLNTSLKKELANFGRFLQLVVEHKHKIGFKGTILIEPKPHEPTKHQYDFDTATVYGFLKKNGLENEVKVNIEANHATLAGHSFDHEIAMADALGIFGSIDINRGDPQNGWDTDQFHNDPLDMTLAMYRILKAGGFTTGGFNFDAKVRRQSIDPADMFFGHVGGLDLLARTLLSAAALIEHGGIDKFVEQRYAKWDADLGKKIHSKDASLASISDAAVAGNINPKPQSGHQEMLENLVTRFV